MEINERLASLETNVEGIKTTLATLAEAIEKLKNEVKPTQKPILHSQKPTQPRPEPKPQPVVQTSEASLTELVNLLNSKLWPHAVDPALICDISSDQDKEDRAEGILDLIIDIHMDNLKFLDFGCGEGHVVNRSRTQKPRMAVGYDINKQDKWDKWEKAPNVLFTADWADVKNSGPYNVVLIYDVIDHMNLPDEEVIAKLKEIKSLMAPNGKVYVRVHPWCSRHGTHLYHQINKAFAHLVFSDEELLKLGFKQEPVRKVLTPLRTYQHLFNSAGFKIYSGPHTIKEAVEPFFINKPIIANRIKEHYKESGNADWKKGIFPTGALEMQFVDYILM